jgi:hypothetical protein
MNKKYVLNNSGVLIPASQKQESKRKPQRPYTVIPAPPSRIPSVVSDITADFVRQIKSELVSELASLLVQGGIQTVKNIIANKNTEEEVLDEPIKMDESIVVTKVAVGPVEKGFSNIAETKSVSDDKIKSSIDKLKSLKDK